MATQNEKNQSNEKAKSDGKVKNFIFKHKFVLFLILVIIVVFAWSLIRMNVLERRHDEHVTELVASYDAKIDSLTISNMKLTVNVFSWAVRSELIRENIEEVNHFFTDFIKIEHVNKVQLINPDDYTVIISTNRKDEGVVVSDQELYSTDKLIVKEQEDDVIFINPVMRLNRKLGILAITMVKSI